MRRCPSSDAPVQLAAVLAALSFAVFAVGCGETDSAAIDTQTSTGANEAASRLTASSELNSVKEADLGQAKPAHSVGQLYLAGLPDVKDFPLWKQKGVETVVSLLSEREIGWDEGAAVREAGMEFVQIPYGDDDAVFDETRRLLRENGDRPLVLHCQASNRVGAVWLTHRVLDEGADVQQALSEAKEAGLRSARLEEQALEYIRRQQAATTDVNAAE